MNRQLLLGITACVLTLAVCGCKWGHSAKNPDGSAQTTAGQTSLIPAIGDVTQTVTTSTTTTSTPSQVANPVVPTTPSTAPVAVPVSPAVQAPVAVVTPPETQAPVQVAPVPETQTPVQVTPVPETVPEVAVPETSLPGEEGMTKPQQSDHSEINDDTLTD